MRREAVRHARARFAAWSLSFRSHVGAGYQESSSICRVYCLAFDSSLLPRTMRRFGTPPARHHPPGSCSLRPTPATGSSGSAIIHPTACRKKGTSQQTVLSQTWWRGEVTREESLLLSRSQTRRIYLQPPCAPTGARIPQDWSRTARPILLSSSQSCHCSASRLLTGTLRRQEVELPHFYTRPPTRHLSEDEDLQHVKGSVATGPSPRKSCVYMHFLSPSC